MSAVGAFVRIVPLHEPFIGAKDRLPFFHPYGFTRAGSDSLDIKPGKAVRLIQDSDLAGTWSAKAIAEASNRDPVARPEGRKHAASLDR